MTRALSNAVRDGRVAHAYLFSGPRGTGKTSTARILAMALNCEHPVDGEPDGVCLSCVEIRRGASMDVQELDAASNRGLDEMRDLLSRVALGVRGRWKVYIIDEVHQLTPNAASALLKTLEEPPAHVVFVLATTDPQKVLPTIRSRTQHFEFHLLGSDVLGELLHSVNERAGLGVAPEAIDLVVRRGHGSARDALTVLDQVAASASDVEDVATVVSDIVDGLAERDPGQVLLAVAEGMSAGRDARRLAADIVEHLRNGFMATMARSLVMLPDDALAEVEEQARRIGPAALVRAMDGIGQALTDMRDSVDPRVTLEVALVRLARPDLDTSTGALLERIERLERAVGVGGRDAGELRGRAGRGGGPQPEPRGSEDSPASAGGSPPVARAPPPSTMGRRPPATGLVASRLPAAAVGELVLLGRRPASRALGARPAGPWRRSEQARRGPGRRRRPAGPRRQAIRAAARRRAGVIPGPRHRCPGEIGRRPRRPTRCRPSPPSVRFGVGRVAAARLAGPGPPALHRARPGTGLVRPHQRPPAPGRAMPPLDLGFLCLRATPPPPLPLEGPPGRRSPAPSLRRAGLAVPVRVPRRGRPVWRCRFGR